MDNAGLGSSNIERNIERQRWWSGGMPISSRKAWHVFAIAATVEGRKSADSTTITSWISVGRFRSISENLRGVGQVQDAITKY